MVDNERSNSLNFTNFQNIIINNRIHRKKFKNHQMNLCIN